MTDTDNTHQSSRQNWLDFLQQQGATIDNGLVREFPAAGTDIPKETALLCDLSSHGVIKACGDEAQAFLQNQFCNDVRNLNDSTSQLNGYCTPKGRLLAVFRLWQQNDCYYLSLPRERLAAVLKRLQMFVLMSKVNLSDTSDEIVTIGLSGTNAEALLHKAVGQEAQSLPSVTDQCLVFNNIAIIRSPGDTPRFEVYGPVTTMQSLWQQLAPQAFCSSETAWQLQDIQAGIPQVVDATAEAYVPQMVNMELINGLSFKKGCYPGQEIVARTHYLGKQKRRMYLAHIDSTTLPKPGDSIIANDDSSGQAVGSVVNAAAAGDGGVDLLAVLQIAKAKADNLLLADGPKSPLTLKDLPYPVEEEDNAK